MPEPATTSWNSRPLFVSSTFADMHAERDDLRVHAFDVLAQQLVERRHYLETIDLRQGVETTTESDEANRDMKVLKVCLGEIERSKPFFVGLIGDRYGWTPPEARMTAAAEAAGFEAEVAGKSVTELEILYGVLENPDQRRRSWFYVRELDYTGMPEDVRKRFDDRFARNTEKAEKLDALRLRIKRQVPDRYWVYRAKWNAEQERVVDCEVERPRSDGQGMETVSLGEAVRNDLWSDIEPETKAWLLAAPQTWQEADARQLDDFVVNRLRIVGDEIRGFVERADVTGPLVDRAFSPAADGTPWGVCLTGEAGSGKSSVFGWVFHELQQRRDNGENLFLLAHAAGIYPRSGSIDTLLRRWIHELAALLEIEDPLETEDGGPRSAEAATSTAAAPSLEPAAATTSPEELEETFASLLGQAAQRARVVILLDALNQLERSIRGRYLTWLPKLWPANVRFLATTIPGTESESLAGRPGVAVETLPQLTVAQARDMAVSFYRERFHREPNAAALDVLLGRTRPEGQPAHGNPLWLELALQEMNLLEGDDYARAEREFPELPGGEQMAALQVREAEELPPTPADVYGQLLARTGRDFGEVPTCAVMDLIALGRGGWRESDLAALVPAVCGEAWDELAFAGVRRTLGTHLVQRGAHAQWDAFHAQLREHILARDLADEAERRRLHGLIADHLENLPEDDPLRVSESMVHLIGFGDRTRAARYLSCFSHGEAPLLAAIAVLAQHAAATAEGLEFMVGLPSVDNLSERNINRTADNLQFEGLEALEREVGLAPRLALLEACRGALERLASSDPSNADWQRGLSVSHIKVGDVLLAQGLMEEALESYRQSIAVAERLASSDPSDAGWQRDLCVSRNKIGDVQHAQGHLDEALEAYQQSMAVRERLTSSDPSNAGWQRDLFVSNINIGDVLLAGGHLGEALEAYLRSIAVAERLASSDPSNAGWQRDLSMSHERIGNVLLAQGQLNEALKSYRQLMAVAERLASSDPSNAGWQRDLGASHERIGHVQHAQGHLDEAVEAYLQSIAIRERLASSDPSNAGWQHDLSASHNNIGHVQHAQGHLDEALEAYLRSMAVAERLASSDPSNAGWQRDLCVSRNNIGDVHHAQGHLDEALESYRQSMAVLERLVSSDPSNAGWQRDLCVSRNNIGDVQHAQGHLDEALEAYQQSMAVRGRLASSDPSNAGWQRDLFVSHINIGNVLLAGGHLGEALEAYRQSMAVAERLASSDPSNAGWQRDLSVSHERIGNVQHAQGNLDEALEAYRHSMAVRGRLASSDPSNAGWQHDLSVSHDNIGDVQHAQGNLGEALEAYLQSMAVLERLALSDPSNAGWQRDLSVSHERIGNVQHAQGNLDEALEAYRHSMAVRGRLASSDPSNAGWQHDLSVSHDNIGDVLLEQGNLAEALEAYRGSMAVQERLAAADPSNAGWQRDLSVSRIKIGDVLLAQDHLGEALEAYRQSMAVLERLVSSDPSNASWQRDLCVNHSKIGDVQRAQGNVGEALEAYRQSMAVLDRLASSDPSNAGWQRDLFVSLSKLAKVAERVGESDAPRLWRRAYETLKGMKDRGLLVSPKDQQSLNKLAKKVGDLRGGIMAETWQCEACGNLNPAASTECLRCGRPSAESGTEDQELGQIAFTEHEWECLKYAPLWVFTAVAKADGKIDENELKSLYRLIQNPQLIEEPLLREVLGEIARDAAGTHKRFFADGRGPDEGLAEVRAVLEEKASPRQAMEFKRALLDIGLDAAASSGGGFVERAALTFAAATLGLTAEDIASDSAG